MADCDLAFLDGPLPHDSLLRSRPDGSPSAGQEAVDLVSLQHSILTALERSADVVEQAKIILKSNNAENTDLEKGVAASSGTNKNPHHGRRQGMGRKKSRFSMKPTLSQESENFNLKLDVENLADPEQYFFAVEKFENTTREINKLRGQTSSFTEEKVHFATARERRPGLTRKRASYIHLGTITDHTDTTMPLPGGNRMTISNPVNVTEIENGNSEVHHSLPSTSPGKNATSSELFNDDKYEGSAINKENKAHALLDSLLSSLQGLDDEDRVMFLQDKLQLKHIDVKKIQFPDYPIKLSSQEDLANTVDGVNQEANARAAKIIPTKDVFSRSPLSAIPLLQNSQKRARLSQVFSSLRKSPLAAMAMLQKKASLVDGPMSAAYASLPTDEEVGSGTSRMETSGGKEASRHSSDKSGFCSNLFELDDISAMDVPSNLQNFASNKPKSLTQNEKNLTSSPSHSNGENGSNHLLQEPCNHSEAMSPLLDRTIPLDQQIVLDGPVVHVSSNGSTLPDENIGTMLLEGSKSGPVVDNTEGLNPEIHDENVNALSSTSSDIHADRNQQSIIDGSDDYNQNIIDLPHHEKYSEACKDQPTIGSSSDQQTGQVKSSQVEEREESRLVSEILVKRKSSKPHPQRQTREVSRRKSLASAGTRWTGGVRRSTRHRMKPLEYWRGERVLYGRIHSTLATVIGVKCSSPGGANLKVKSYVSDQYKDLVESAALH